MNLVDDLKKKGFNVQSQRRSFSAWVAGIPQEQWIRPSAGEFHCTTVSHFFLFKLRDWTVGDIQTYEKEVALA